MFSGTPVSGGTDATYTLAIDRKGRPNVQVFIRIAGANGTLCNYVVDQTPAYGGFDAFECVPPVSGILRPDGVKQAQVRLTNYGRSAITVRITNNTGSVTAYWEAY